MGVKEIQGKGKIIDLSYSLGKCGVSLKGSG